MDGGRCGGLGWLERILRDTRELEICGELVREEMDGGVGGYEWRGLMLVLVFQGVLIKGRHCTCLGGLPCHVD